MPSFHGIEVSVLTQSDVGRLPEFPHPNGTRSSFQPRASLGTAGHQSPQEAPVKVSAGSVEEESTVSVYIPSVPGAQFWINYLVEQDPAPPGHLFFKLYMNGRHITSWGINPRDKTRGQVEKALYEPSDRWDQDDNGTIMKQNGIEARYFHFVGGQQEKSVAEDGGLIEVQVFRAKGRKRRAAKLDQYRHQEKYGIAAPSGGLLDNPQDVTFFDFHLIDPKDAPFASFQFHYRSWENLRQLNFVPLVESIDPIVLSTSTVTSNPNIIANTNGTVREESSSEPTSLRTDIDEFVFDDSGSGEDWLGPKDCNNKERPNSLFVLRAPPQLRPRSATSNNLPQPSKTLRDGIPHGVPDLYLQRPLPDRPLPELPIGRSDGTWIARSRKSSTASAAASVTPSLLSYVKDGSLMEESVEYGQAQEVQICKRQSEAPPDKVGAFPDTNDTSISDYEGSPMAENDPRERHSLLLSPGNYLASTGSMLEKHISQCEGKHDSPSGQHDRRNSPESKDASRGQGEMGIDFSKFPHLHLSESDWTRRTPSPTIPRSILSPKRFWNTLRRNKSRSPLREIHGDVMARNQSTPDLVGQERNGRHGNWI